MGDTVYFGNIVYASRKLITNTIECLFKSEPITITCDLVVEGTITGTYTVPPARIITIAQSGAQFNNFPDALAHASTLNPTAGNSVLIKGAPGTYFVNDTLMWPGYVDFTGQNGNIIIVITNPTKNIIEFQPGVVVIERLMVSGALNACGYVSNVPGIVQLLWCQVFGCDIGIHSDGVGSFIRIVTSGTPGTVNTFAQAINNGQISVVSTLCKNASIGYVIESGGHARFIDSIVEDTTIGFDIRDGTCEMSSCHMFNCGTGIKCSTGAQVIGTEFNAFDCTVDLETSNDIISCTLGNSRMDESKLVLADESLTSLNINDEQGKDKYYGSATVLETQQIDLFGAAEAGTQMPNRAIFQDDGQNTPIGFALNFVNSLGKYATIPNDGSMTFNNSYSLEFWFKPTMGNNNTQYLFYKASSFFVAYIKTSGQLYFYAWGIGYTTSNTGVNTVLNNQRNYITFVMDTVASEVRIYINNKLNTSKNFVGSPLNSANPIYIGNNSSLSSYYYTSAVVDEINFWNKSLNTAEIATHYNGGKGITNTDTINLMAGYHCNEGSGSVLTDYSGNGNNGTHNSIEYLSGLINATTNSSIGVLAYHFNSDINEELFMNTHLNSGYKSNEAIIPIVRWAPKSTAVGDVVWGLEYTTANPGSVFPTTQIIQATTTTNGTSLEHQETILPSFTTANYQTIIMGRLFRYGTDVADTYPNDVALLGFEFKYVKNKLGSDT